MQMRAGTQTLIQALHAMPWTEEAENEDESSSAEDTHNDTDEEGKHAAVIRSYSFADI